MRTSRSTSRITSGEASLNAFLKSEKTTTALRPMIWASRNGRQVCVPTPRLMEKDSRAEDQSPTYSSMARTIRSIVLPRQLCRDVRLRCWKNGGTLPGGRHGPTHIRGVVECQQLGVCHESGRVEYTSRVSNPIFAG